MADEILYAVHDGVATITLNRPAKKNALTVDMYKMLVDFLRRAEEDPAARVVHLRASGDAFTSGNDLNDFMNTPPAGPDSPVFDLLLALVDLETPIVAEVNGPAVGIGVTMLFQFDLVYAAKRAKFQMPFVNLGLCPEGASSFLLPRFMGFPQATELLMFGEAISAERAEKLGLVNEVVDDDELSTFVAERIRKLVSQPAASLRASKRLLRENMREGIKEAMFREGALFVERLGSPEAAEAFTAFFEKRKPDFSGFD